MKDFTCQLDTNVFSAIRHVNHAVMESIVQLVQKDIVWTQCKNVSFARRRIAQFARFWMFVKNANRITIWILKIEFAWFCKLKIMFKGA